MTANTHGSWPAGHGEMVTRVREHAWSATPLGPVQRWPQHLRAVVDMLLASGFPMVALWGTDLIQLYNDGYRELMGVKHPAGLGRPTRECWPEVWHINNPIYARVFAGETLTFEDALYPITRSGLLEDAWFTLAYSPLRNEVGEVAGVLVTVFETTPRHHADALRAEMLARDRAAHAAAERERQKLHALFMQTPVAICMLEGPQHVFTFANPLYRALIGGRDVVGKPLLDALPDARDGGFDKILDGVFATGNAYFGKESLVKLAEHGPDDGLIVNFVYQPMRNAEGEVDGILAAVTDVTEQVRARQQLEAFAETLRERTDFERQLIGIVSHDLRDPLNVVALAAGVLMQLGLEDKARTVVGRIVSSTGRAKRLIGDLLDFTQVRLGGGFPMTLQPFDFHVFARQVVDDFRVSHPECLLWFESSGDAVGTWDEDRMTQMLGNLLGNAIRYRAAGTPVHVATRGSHRTVELTVHNEGRPIAPDELPRLFQPMQRGDTTSATRGRSVGLGLYIVKHIVDAHDGTVQVVSREGEGTTFRVVLPLQRPTDGTLTATREDGTLARTSAG